MRMDETGPEIQEPEEFGVGFVPMVEKKSKHECRFNPFPNTSPYHKHGDTDRAFMTIGCECGAVKEVIVQNLKP